MSNANLKEAILAAIGAHDAWKMKLSTAINLGKTEVPINDVACDNACIFGKWLYSDEIAPDMKEGKPYQVTKRLHAEFHHIAGDITRLALEGNKDQARTLMQTDFQTQSGKLRKALEKWRRELS